MPHKLARRTDAVSNAHPLVTSVARRPRRHRRLKRCNRCMMRSCRDGIARASHALPWPACEVARNETLAAVKRSVISNLIEHLARSLQAVYIALMPRCARLQHQARSWRRRADRRNAVIPAISTSFDDELNSAFCAPEAAMPVSRADGYKPVCVVINRRCATYRRAAARFGGVGGLWMSRAFRLLS